MAQDRLLWNRSIRHAAMIDRYSEGEARRIIRFLENAVLPNLEAKIRLRLSKIRGRGYDLGPATTKRLDNLYKALDDLIVQAHGLAKGETIEGLVALAKQEAAFQAKALEGALDAIDYTAQLPAPSVLRSIVTSRPFDGMVLGDWYSRQTRSMRQAVRQQVNIGIAQGETTDQMMKRLVGVFDGDKRGARAIVRTATNHVVNHAALASMQANADVYDGWEFVAVLDANTTLECAGLDGTVYELDDYSRLPPRHFGCRSAAVGKLKSYKELGFPDIEDTEPVSRESAAGPVAGDLTYQGWLKQMDSDPKTRHYVDDALGPRRANLWRQGVDIKRFTSEQGDTLTLVELEKKEGIKAA